MGTFSDRDNGARALRSRRRGPRLVLRVGVVGARAAQAHPSADGLTYATLMAIHELGTNDGRIPARSWLRGWFDETKVGIRNAMRTMARRVYDPNDPLTELQALEQLGALFAADIQERISDGIAPPNAPRTIARKGSSTPLIDTGEARQSITWEVVAR